MQLSKIAKGLIGIPDDKYTQKKLKDLIKYSKTSYKSSLIRICMIPIWSYLLLLPYISIPLYSANDGFYKNRYILVAMAYGSIFLIITPYEIIKTFIPAITIPVKAVVLLCIITISFNTIIQIIVYTRTIIYPIPGIALINVVISTLSIMVTPRIVTPRKIWKISNKNKNLITFVNASRIIFLGTVIYPLYMPLYKMVQTNILLRVIATFGFSCIKSLLIWMLQRNKIKTFRYPSVRVISYSQSENRDKTLFTSTDSINNSLIADMSLTMASRIQSLYSMFSLLCFLSQNSIYNAIEFLIIELFWDIIYLWNLKIRVNKIYQSVSLLKSHKIRSADLLKSHKSQNLLDVLNEISLNSTRKRSSVSLRKNPRLFNFFRKTLDIKNENNNTTKFEPLSVKSTNVIKSHTKNGELSIVSDDKDIRMASLILDNGLSVLYFTEYIGILRWIDVANVLRYSLIIYTGLFLPIKNYDYIIIGLLNDRNEMRETLIFLGAYVSVKIFYFIFLHFIIWQFTGYSLLKQLSMAFRLQNMPMVLAFTLTALYALTWNSPHSGLFYGIEKAIKGYNQQ